MYKITICIIVMCEMIFIAMAISCNIFESRRYHIIAEKIGFSFLGVGVIIGIVPMVMLLMEKL